MQVMAVKSRDGNSRLCAAWIIISPKITPMPVMETMPTTMDMALKPDLTMALGMVLMVKRFFLSKSMTTGTAQVAHRAE